MGTPQEMHPPVQYGITIPPGPAADMAQRMHTLTEFVAQHGLEIARQPTEQPFTTTELQIASQGLFKTPAYGSYAGAIIDQIRQATIGASVVADRQRNVCFVSLPRFDLTATTAIIGTKTMSDFDIDPATRRLLDATNSPFPFIITPIASNRRDERTLRQIHPLPPTPARLARYLVPRGPNTLLGAGGKATDILLKIAGILLKKRVPRDWEGPFIAPDQLDEKMTDAGINPSQRGTVLKKIERAVYFQNHQGQAAPHGEIIVEIDPTDFSPQITWSSIAVASLANVARSYRVPVPAVEFLKELAGEG